MSQVIFIRHSISEIDATLPANQWRLSHAGRTKCQQLADRLESHKLTLLISSIEAKAIETAQLAAAPLGISSQIASGLHEHDRSNVGFLSDRSIFQQQVKNFFDKPKELVFGKETADQAHARFSAATQEVFAAYPEERLGIVAHGTVIALLVSRANQMSPFEFWESLQMPCYVVLTLPRLELIEVVSKLD